jgi:hypothetical protein
MNETPDSLLATDEPPPFTVDNENGTSPLLIVADHAGKHFPRRLGQLGLSNAECERHIAWDIGVGAVCSLIGKAVNAVVVRQNYSRLVIDCNRTLGSGTSILDLSELTRVPGNIGLSERHKLARVREIFQPYHDRIATELDRRREAARPTSLDFRAQLHSRLQDRGAALACRRAHPVHRQRCRRTESRDCFRTSATAIGLGRRAEYSSPVSRSVCRMISLPWAWSAESLGQT